MCGIVGVFDRRGGSVPEAVVTRMTSALAHRGPDGEGSYHDAGLAFGHRRLAIIDLTDAGRQPMETEDGRLVLNFNGEIYNFRELKRRLEERGHSFRSRTDSEVLLHAYREWGVDCVPKLNGMFAFAIWDRDRRTLLLARDRFGVKPLYYTWIGDTLLFASEVKAFLAHPGFAARLSAPHLVEYFTFQNVLSDGTLFEGVKLLPAGHTLTLRGEGSAEPQRYWDFDFHDGGVRGDPVELEEELERLFRQAVTRQLVSDAPLGCYLSGGMDSGSITALAARELRFMRTFTGGFDLTTASEWEQSFDERRKAERLSYLLDTEHYEVVLKPRDLERCLADLVWHLEDLRVGQSYPNYFVARLASKFVKVVLSGTGGDELFAGYPWRYYQGLSQSGLDGYRCAYFGYWNRLVPEDVAERFFRPDVLAAAPDRGPRDAFDAVLNGRRDGAATPQDLVNEALYFEAKTFLHGLLVVDDRLAMAHGLEARVPFLDNDLVDFAQQLPVAYKLRDLDRAASAGARGAADLAAFLGKTDDGKILLRRVMERYVPRHVTEQVKQGFSGPDESWFREESAGYVRDRLLRRDARMYEFLEPGTVQELVDRHLEGRQNQRLLIWSLLNFEHWCSIFLDGQRPGAG